MITAAAPSLMPEALPAVTRAVLVERRPQAASASSVRAVLGVFVGIEHQRRAFFCGISSGRISSLNLPAFCAASALCCEASGERVLLARATRRTSSRRSRR